MAFRSWSAGWRGSAGVLPLVRAGVCAWRADCEATDSWFARLRQWALDEGAFTGARVRYVLDSERLTTGEVPWIEDEPNVRFHAAYEVCASDTLTMTLTVTNTGGEPMSYEAALHSYLHVGDVLGARLVGLRGATYLDATEAGFPPKLQEQPSVMFGDQPVDRVYYSDAALELQDHVLGRVIRIGKTGSPQTVVWNPGEQGGNAIAHAKTGEWRGFVAVEAAACRDRIVALVRVNRICFRSPLP